MTNSRALTARKTIQIGMRLPTSNDPTLPLEADYQLGNIVPEFPTVNNSFEESGDYSGTFEAIGDVAKIDGYGEQTLVFERLTFANMVVLAEIWARAGAAGIGDPPVWTTNSSSTSDGAVVFTEVGVPLGNAGTQFVLTLQEAVAASFELTGSSDAAYLTGTLNLRGNEPSKIATLSATSTPSPVPDPEKIKHSWVQLFIDDTEIGIGTTEIECTRLDFTLTIDNNVDTVQVDCGPLTGRGLRYAQLELNLVLNTESAAEYVDYLAETTRFVRLKATSPVTSQYWQFDFVGKFQSYSPGTAGAFESMTLMAKSQLSTVWGYSWQQKCQVDDLTSIPYYTTIP